MKKTALLLLSITFIIFGAVGAKTALADTTSSTSLILPSTYLEYYQLYSPVSVWTSGTEYVIAENNKIIYFDGNDYHAFPLADYTISKVSKIQNHVLFISNSEIFTLNVQNGNVTKQTSVITSTDFHVFDNVLITNPSNQIREYVITTTQTEFTATEILPKRKTLTFTPNTLIANATELFYTHENNVYRVTDADSRIICNNINNVRSLALAENKLFISHDNGITTLNSSTGEQLNFLPISGEMTLSNVNHPRGIFFNGNHLYIADDSLNAILQMDVTTYSLTDFCITANHNATGRISKDASDIVCTKNSVFVLDRSIIKVIDQKTKAVSQIPLTGYSGLKIMAHTNGFFLLSSGSNLILLKRDKSTVTEQQIVGNVNRLENVTALSTFENDFYILNNETVANQQKAVVYRLDTTTFTLSQHSIVPGRGDALTTDVFGDIYVEVYSEVDNTYYVYANDLSATKNKLITTSTSKFLSIFADYEGNLFGLLQNNSVAKITNGQTQNHPLVISQNLPENQTAIDFAHIDGTDSVYFLFRGFVLCALSDDLNVSTPQKIAVPQDFAITFDQDPTFVTLKSGAKMFEVSLSDAPNFGEHFNYKEMSANKSTTHEYIKIAETGRYSLVISSNQCAIVRTEDVIEKQISQVETGVEKYAVNDCYLYTHPLVTNFTKQTPLAKNALVTAICELQFNGTSYTLISVNDSKGFVATSMLKNGVASNDATKQTTSQTLANSTQAFANEQLSDQLFIIEKGSVVTVLSTQNGVSKVVYNGRICFVDQESLQPKSNTVTRNVVVISLLFVGLFVTCLYLGTLLFKTKLKN